MSHDRPSSTDLEGRGQYNKAHRQLEAERRIARYMKLLAVDHRTIDAVEKRLQAGALGSLDIAQSERLRKTLLRHVVWCERRMGLVLSQR